jgi:hypothetical protein
MTLTPHTPVPATGSAALAVGTGPALPIPGGYVQLDDRSVLDRMLSNIRDNEALLAAVKAHHVMDAGGPLMQAFSRLVGMEEAEAIEVRHINNLLGGK